MNKSAFILSGLLIFCHIFSYAQTERELIQTGITALKAKNYELAIEYLNQAIQKNNSNITALNARALAKKGAGQYEEAILDFDRAILLKPHVGSLYNNRGSVKEEMGMIRAAIADFDLALRYAPRDKTAYFNRGNAIHQLGQYERAIKDYTAAIEIDQDFAAAYHYRGNRKQELGDYLGAIKDYDFAIRIQPSYADAYNSRGNAKRRLRWIQASKEDYAQAIRLQPRFVHAYLNRAKLNDEQSLYEESIQDYEQVLRWLPSNDIARIGLEKAKEAILRRTVSKRPGIHVLSIGISDYSSSLLEPLRSPGEQAYKFQLSFQESSMSYKDILTLTNARAKRRDIIEGIKGQFCDPSKVKKEDLVIFYFSGHGAAVGDKIGICPHDYYDMEHLISDQEIRDLLSKSPARHKVCIIEACKSEIAPMSIKDSFTHADLMRFHQSRHAIQDGIVFITSTEVGANSLELPDKGGIFSHYLFEAMKGEADFNKDRQISSQELYDYLKTKVSKATHQQQVPQINDEGYQLDLPIFMLKE